MRRVGIEETAAIGAQLFNGDLRSCRPDRQHLLGLLNGDHDRVTGGILIGLPLASVWACW